MRGAKRPCELAQGRSRIGGDSHTRRGIRTLPEPGRKVGQRFRQRLARRRLGARLYGAAIYENSYLLTQPVANVQSKMAPKSTTEAAKNV
jgi:hypothetical protein